MTDEELDTKLESVDAEQAAAAMSPDERSEMLVQLWRAAFQGHGAPNEETISVFKNWWLPNEDSTGPLRPTAREIEAAERIRSELFERWGRTQERGK